jgi:hypothetical protein
MDELMRSYNKAVAALPEHLRARADDRTSNRFAGKDWQIRDADGVLLNPVYTLSPKTKPKPAPRPIAPAGMTKSERKLLLASAAKLGELYDAFNEVVPKLDDQIKQLNGDQFIKTLDAQAYDSLVEMAERVEQLEQSLREIADNGFRYRGYWREGMKAKRGDAYTESGSLWWAVRNTDDRPCYESPDWQIAVRKGRDGK